jgi:hypothetical protein
MTVRDVRANFIGAFLFDGIGLDCAAMAFSPSLLIDLQVADRTRIEFAVRAKFICTAWKL